MPRHPASYRDPSGQVHLRDGRVYRSILPPGTAHYRAAKASGFLAAATASGRLIGATEVDRAILADEAPDAEFVLEHPALDFISHPYEWPFGALREAALLTLDLHTEALQHDLTLSDASAFNVQFVGPRPLFIDYLSVIKYEPGQVWLGYRQFCEQFLNPLLLTATTGVPYHPFYRGALEGIRSSDLAALLPLRAKLGPRVALHVLLQARLQGRVDTAAIDRARKVTISKAALTANITSLRSWVASLKPPGTQITPWQHYERSVSYSAEERARKAAFVAEFVSASQPRLVWDIGCNSGEYSEIATASGAGTVIGFEPDHGALNAAYERARAKGLPFLPLCVDVVNPSPASGWREQERAGLAGRHGADLVMGLALVHHLILGRNLPLDDVAAWFTSLAPRGIVEFVPREDPMVRQLLALKPDPGIRFDADAFGEALAARASVVRREQVTASGRVLFAFAR